MTQDNIEIRYRTWGNALPPQPIRLKIAGWAGDSKDHDNGSKPQPWHCLPFVEGSTYGLELLYPFSTECRVVNVNGKAVFEGNWQSTSNIPPGVKWPPFEIFAPGHYGFTSSFDIIAPPGYVIRIESHPRYYTDETWSTPCIVPGHIQTEWWPRIFFIVFKIPPPEQVHVFKYRQPYGQILILPRKVSYDIGPMDAVEAAERVNLERLITSAEDYLAENTWADHVGNRFNDKYKVLSRIFNKEGYAGVKKFIEERAKKRQEDAEAKQASASQRMKRILIT